MRNYILLIQLRSWNEITSVLHQLDQKIIYPHYDFKHLTEKYFEIGMKLDDFLIQLMKYCNLRNAFFNSNEIREQSMESFKYSAKLNQVISQRVLRACLKIKINSTIGAKCCQIRSKVHLNFGKIHITL